MLGRTPKKPKERVVRPMDTGTIYPTFEGGYVVPTLGATRLLVRLRVAVGDPGVFYLKIYALGEDGFQYPLTVDNGATVAVVAGVGTQTDVDTAVKRFVRTNNGDNATYEIDVETKKTVVLYVAAEDAETPDYELSVAWKLE